LLSTAQCMLHMLSAMMAAFPGSRETRRERELCTEFGCIWFRCMVLLAMHAMESPHELLHSVDRMMKPLPAAAAAAGAGARCSLAPPEAGCAVLHGTVIRCQQRSLRFDHSVSLIALVPALGILLLTLIYAQRGRSHRGIQGGRGGSGCRGRR
jgi:hypothetical protein